VADRVGDVRDTFVELGGDVAGVRIPQIQTAGSDQYAELFVAKGTIADVEAVVGPAKRSLHMHPESPEMFIAYPIVAGHHLRVLIEQAYETKKLVVMIHYKNG
jgi:hypothetical protein